MAKAPDAVEQLFNESNEKPLENYRDFTVSTVEGELIATLMAGGRAIVKDGYKVSGYDKA